MIGGSEKVYKRLLIDTVDYFNKAEMIKLIIKILIVVLFCFSHTLFSAKLGSTRLVRQTSQESIEDILLGLSDLLDESKSMGLLKTVRQYFEPDGEIRYVLGTIRDFLQEAKQESLQKGNGDYEFISNIIVPTVSGIFDYYNQTDDDYENLVLREPKYELKLNLDKFPEILKKAVEDVKLYVDDWYHSTEWWMERSPSGIRALIDIFSEQEEIEPYKIMPGEKTFRNFLFISNSSAARTLGPVYIFFRSASKQEIKSKFPNVDTNDFDKGPGYVMMKALNFLPKNFQQWRDRIAYQIENSGKLIDGWERVPFWAQRKIVIKSLIKEWGPKLGQHFGMDYYNWQKLSLERENISVPTWRISRRFFYTQMEVGNDKIKMEVPFLGERWKEKGNYISLRGLYKAYDRNFNKMYNELKLGPGDKRLYFWIDNIRWKEGSKSWDDFLPKDKNEKEKVLKHIALRITQEKDVPLEDLNPDLFKTVKFARKPGSSYRHLATLVANLKWDYYSSLIQELETEIKNELKELEELVHKGRKNIHWKKYHLETIKRFVDKLIDENPLELEFQEVTNNSRLFAVVGSFTGGADVDRLDLALFKGTLYVDYDLPQRIATPFTTIDYLLRFYYVNFDSLTANKLPKGVTREINQMLAKKLNKSSVNELKKSDYENTKIVDFVDWMVRKDPLNLLSPTDKELFKLAKDSLEKSKIWSYWKQMTLSPFYESNKR